MAWTETQQKAVAIVPKCSSLLSLTGSLWIVIEVSFDSNKSKNVYHQLLLAMSVYDVLESVFNFASSWAIPEGTEGVWNPMGSQQTCSAQGYFLQFGLGIPIYNACLSIYYLLVIRYGVSEQRLRRWVAPIMHATAFMIAFGTATAAIPLDLYNNANLWCWIAPLPAGCDKDDTVECIRGDNAWLYRWVFYFTPLWTSILTSIGCTIMVYLSVRRREAKTAIYRSPTSKVISVARQQSTDASATAYGSKNSNGPNSYNQGVEIADEANNHPQGDTNNAFSRNGNEADEKGPSGTFQGSSNAIASTYGRKNSNDGSNGYNQGVEIAGEANIHLPNIAASENGNEADQKRPSGIFQRSRRSLQKGLKRTLTAMSGDSSDRRNLNPRSREVLNQAIFFVMAFWMTHLFSTINRALQLSQGYTYFPLVVLHSFFDPLQGFLNFVVYRRPRYMRHRNRNPEMTRAEAFSQTLRWSFLCPMNQKPKNPPPIEYSEDGFAAEEESKKVYATNGQHDVQRLASISENFPSPSTDHFSSSLTGPNSDEPSSSTDFVPSPGMAVAAREQSRRSWRGSSELSLNNGERRSWLGSSELSLGDGRRNYSFSGQIHTEGRSSLRGSSKTFDGDTLGIDAQNGEESSQNGRRSDSVAIQGIHELSDEIGASSRRESELSRRSSGLVLLADDIFESVSVSIGMQDSTLAMERYSLSSDDSSISYIA